MKKFLLIIFSFLFICGSKAAVKIGDLYYNLDDRDYTATVTYEYSSSNSNYSGLTSVAIPATLEYYNTTYTVVSIGYEAFSRSKSLTSIVIPNTIKKINYDAFSYCTGLASIEIPNSVTSIGNWAFSNCTGLASVEISNSVTSIGSDAFKGCTSLTQVKLPASVEEIGDNAFSNCSGLSSIEIPNSVTSIGAGAFNGCTGLTSLYFNAENCQYCGNVSFPVFPSNLNQLVIGDNVKTIPDYAFMNISGIRSVEIPNSVTSIGLGVFYGCTKLTTLNFNARNCDTCGSSSSPAFPRSVSNIVIGEGVEVIPENAFCGLVALTKVTLPNSVTLIRNGAFEGCSGLKEVTVSNSLTSIGGWSFHGCSSLAGLQLPSTLSYIGDYAFYECSGLKSIEIPSGVTSIKNHTFKKCSGLASVKLPGSLASIEDYAFELCTNLKSLELPTSLTLIGEGAFSECSNLSSITFKSTGLLTIGNGAFNNCNNITDIYCDTQRPPVSNGFDVFTDAVYKSAALYVPADQKSLYYTVTPWSKFINIRDLSASDKPGGVAEIKIVPVLSVGEKLRLDVKTADGYALSDTRTWQSSNPIVASVTSEGLVSAVATGNAVITVTTGDSSTAEIDLEVVDDNVDNGIEFLVSPNENEYIVYSTSGVLLLDRVSKEDLRILTPGVYIINGKKVMVR